MSDKNDVTIEVSGLGSHANELLTPGALLKAENAVISRENVVERRFGFENLSTNLPDYLPNQLISIGGVMYMQLDDGLWYYNTSSSSWVRLFVKNTQRFYNPSGIWGNSTHLYISEITNTNVIIRITLATGVGEIWAGSFGTASALDGTGTAATFSNPYGLWGNSTDLYVADLANHIIRKISLATAAVTTWAGSGVNSSVDGLGTLATFTTPYSLWGNATHLYVAEQKVIRKIQLSNADVVTWAGSAGGAGDTDGTGVAARFTDARGIWGDATNIYVSDDNRHVIRKIVISSAAVTTWAGLAGTSGTTNATGTAARFNAPNGLWGDSTNLYVADSDNYRVRQIVLSSAVVTTLAGSASGSTDGIGALATFNKPRFLWSSGDSLYITDDTNYLLRKCYISSGYTFTLAGEVGVVGLARNNGTSGGIIYGPTANTVRMRGAEYNGNTFVTTAVGIQKLTGTSSSGTSAGMPRGLDLTLTKAAAGAGFLALDYSTSYRIVWGIRDANNNLILGAPSARFTIANPSGGGATADTITVASNIPPGITTANFWQLYRAVQVASTSDPGDELFLCYEANPTSSQITAGSVSVVDITPDTFLDVALYTNATQETIAKANDQPPLAKDIALYKDHLLLTNTTSKQRLQINLVGTSLFVSGTSTLTIGGVVYTAHTTVSAVTSFAPTSEDATTGTFVYWTSGTDAQNIEATAKSICRVINSYQANTAYLAYYVSTFDGVPGNILLEERGVGGSSFAVTCNAAASTGKMFSPQIAASGTALSSTNDAAINRLYYSKYQQPEHVPTAQYLPVGPKTEAIQRVLALRDSAIIIKDNSVWRLTGNTAADFQISLLDNTVSISARDSAAVLNNQVFCLTSQGFVSIDDNGVKIVGRSIENRVLAMLEKLSAPDHTTFVAASLEAQRLYVCAAYDPITAENIAYVYNAITRAWSTWFISANCLAVLSDRLYYGLDNAYGHVLRQRASRRDAAISQRDYAEESSTITLSAVDTSAGTATFSMSYGVNYDSYAPSLAYGWKMYIGSNQYLVTDVSGSTVTFNTGVGLTNTANTIYRPIPMAAEYAPKAPSPIEMKQFGEVVIVAETQDAHRATITYTNELDYRLDSVSDEYSSSPPSDNVSITNPSASGAANDFGATNGSVYPFRRIRTNVRNSRAIGEQLGIRIENNVAEARFAIKAVGVGIRGTGSTKGKQ